MTPLGGPVPQPEFSSPHAAALATGPQNKPRLRQLASALAMSGAGALVASGPAVIRTSGVNLAAALFVSSGALLLPLTVVVLLLRGARGGLRVLEGRHARVHLAAFAAWCTIVSLAFAVLGTGLRATTHHHALAGVTFSILGLGSALAAAVVARRAASILIAASSPTRRVALGAFWIALSVAVLLLGVAGGARASMDHASGTSALVVDLVAFSLAAGFASRPLGAREVLVARFAPLAFLLLPLAVGLSRMSPALSPVLVDDAPLFALLVGAPSVRAEPESSEPSSTSSSMPSSASGHGARE